MRFLHEGVGKADFGPVDSAIAGCFDKGKIVGVLGIKYNLVDDIL